jgi:hypothetical protein
MTLTRRDALAGSTALAAACALAPMANAAALPASPEPEPDRELRLRLSDCFCTQTWTYAGQTWDEQRPELILFEDEVLRVTIENDTGDDAPIDFGRLASTMRLAPRETRSATFRVRGLDPVAIRDGRPSGTRRIALVRATYGAHALV